MATRRPPPKKQKPQHDPTPPPSDVGFDPYAKREEDAVDAVARVLALPLDDTPAESPRARSASLGPHVEMSDARHLRAELLARMKKAGVDVAMKGVDDGAKAGVALDVDEWPINGLRHEPNRGESGWYLWCGKRDVPDGGERAEAFAMIRLGELQRTLVDALPYLGLPPGWRFTVAPGYEDVWFDEELLDE